MSDRSKWAYGAFWCLLALGAYVGAFRSMGDADIWFQLLAGKYALAHGAVPHTDFFLYVGQQAPQQFGGWGFGLIYELAIEAFGLPAATFLNSAIWTLAFFFALRAAMFRAGKTYWSLSSTQVLVVALAMSAIFIASSTRMTMRAESTLVLSWAMALWLFERCKAKGSYMGFWVGLPLIGLAEAWLHTGGFVLLVALPICFARLGKAQWLRRDTWLAWVLCALALALLPMLNPNGPMQVYTQLIQIVRMLAGVAGPVAPSNLEYLPMWDVRSIAILPKFLVLTALSLAIWLRKPTPGSVVENLACLAFLALAALHNRGISLAAMLAMVPALELAMSAGVKRSKVSMKVALPLAWALCLAPIGISWTQPSFGIQKTTMGFEEWAKIIKKAHPNGARILTVEGGPALAYALSDERYLVSKGGHALLPNPEADRHQWIAIHGEEGWEKELAERYVDTVCLPFYMSLPGRGIFYWLPSMLAADSHWGMHVGDGCNLFIKMPAGQTLTDAEQEEKLTGYLQNLALFSKASYYGQPDVLGQEMGLAAQKKLDALSEKRKAKEKKGVAPSSAS